MEEETIIFDDFLPEDLCESMIEEYANKDQVDRTNRTHWSKQITERSNIVLVNDLDKKYADVIFQIMAGREPFKEMCKKSPLSALFYRWTPLSYIPPHQDDGIPYALTIHLNKKYIPNYGGLYLFKPSGRDNWVGVEPIYNRAVYASGNAWHMVTPVTNDKDRLSIQVFSSE